MNATASQRVQRGTNRPPGNRKKNNVEQTGPTICTPLTGNHQAGWEEIKVFAAVGMTATGPKDTRNSETSSAISTTSQTAVQFTLVEALTSDVNLRACPPLYSVVSLTTTVPAGLLAKFSPST